MGIRDLFFGKEEEEEEDDLNPQAKERPVAKVKPGRRKIRIGCSCGGNTTCFFQGSRGRTQGIEDPHGAGKKGKELGR